MIHVFVLTRDNSARIDKKTVEADYSLTPVRHHGYC